MLRGKGPKAKFLSRYAGGWWYNPRISKTGADADAVDTVNRLTIPPNLATDLGNRGVIGLVPCVGILGKFTVNTDFDVAAQNLYATRHELGTYFKLQITNAFQRKYTPSDYCLTQWEYLAKLVNPRVDRLRNKHPQLQSPVPGVSLAVPSADTGQYGSLAGARGAAGAPPKYTEGLNTIVKDPANNNHAVDPTDNWFGQMDGLFPVRTTGGATVQHKMSHLWVIPLCAMAGTLAEESFPLESICDNKNPWVFEVTKTETFANSLIGFDGGTIVCDEVSLHIYVMPQRAEDERACGNPWYVVEVPRQGSPFTYPGGKVVLASGNLPDFVPGTAITIDARAYSRRILYGNFSQDFISTAVMDLYSDGVCNFPPNAKDRNPLRFYEMLYNVNRERPIMRPYYPNATGVPQIVVRGGTDRNVALTYQNIIDTSLAGLLPEISPHPVRLFAVTNLNMQGLPGFGTMDSACAAPYITFEGWLPDQDTLDIYLNVEEQDLAYLDSMGNTCCDDRKPVFVNNVDKGTSPKASVILAAGITPRIEIPLKVAAAVGVPTSSEALVDNPVGKPAGMTTG